MEDSKRTLVILLSMHRCGSSLATSILHCMGMSLGPFELMDAAPSNPHGHFEALPFYDLNRRVQALALGFPDDLPESPAVLASLTATQGAWPASTRIPDELFDQGRALIRELIESGEISGFKDPRTVLTWPFWERVLESFPDVRVVAVSLLRSPHEIAMSLVNRRNGWVGYWASLDVIAVHLRRQKSILERWGSPPRGACFGSPSFMESLVEICRHCGLTWDQNRARALFDPECIHQSPATVPHEAQDLFDALHGKPAVSEAGNAYGIQFIKDVRLLEAQRLEQWRAASQAMIDANDRADHAIALADRLGKQLRESEARSIESQLRLLESQRGLIESQRALLEAHQSISQARARELAAWDQYHALRGRLDRYESHPILGPALRGRRRLRKVIDFIVTNTTNRTGSRPIEDVAGST